MNGMNTSSSTGSFTLTWNHLLALVVMLALTAMAPSCSCDDEKSNSDSQCAAGSLNCVCDDGACSDGLECDRGYCVESECPRGTESCACLDDGTCNVAAGENLVCQNNVCITNGGIEQGSAGGACFENGSCNSGLECKSGICEEPGCPNGDLGCACGPGGACNDEEATCNDDNVCARAGCDGEENCGCVGGTSCNEGLACENNVCRAPNGLKLEVSNPEVRSCDILVMEGARRIDNAVYSGDVIGRVLKKSPRVGFAFAARENQALSGRLATITFEGSEPVTEDVMSTISVTCYAADGSEVASPGVTMTP